MDDRGSALLTAVVAVLVLLFISGVMYVVLDYRSQLASSEEKGLQAYYLAEAGTNWEISKVVQAYVYDNPQTEGDLTVFMANYTVRQPVNNGVLAGFPAGIAANVQAWVYQYTYGAPCFITVKAEANYEGADRTIEEVYSLP